MHEAKNYLRQHRNVPLLDSSETLISDFPQAWGSSDNQLNRHSIYSAVTGKTEIIRSDTRDEQMMREFITHTVKDMAVIPDMFPRKKILQGGIPLLDIVRAHREKLDVWQFPSKQTLEQWATNRSVQMDTLQEVKVKEIVVGRTSDEQLLHLKEWVLERYLQDQSLNPTGTIPLVVKDIAITQYDMIRMSRSEMHGKNLKLARNIDIMEQHEKEWFIDSDGKEILDRWVKIPWKVVIGNGINWLMIISSDSDVDEEGRYYCKPAPIPDELIDIFDSLPTISGYQIQSDLIKLGRRHCT